jgi:ATP adenylyltransferase
VTEAAGEVSGAEPALGRLWAGWRSAFVMASADAGNRPQRQGGAGDESQPTDCVFCALFASGRPDTDTHIVWRHGGGLAVAILNRYPYTSGHLMVMPIRHVADMEALSADESAAVWLGMADAVRALKDAYRPEGFNLGANLGQAAGAGVPSHFHLHVVPRWVGDTNFMTTAADARVLPEALADTDARVRAAWPRGGGAS